MVYDYMNVIQCHAFPDITLVVNNADCMITCISLIPWSQVCSHMNFVLIWGYWTLLNKIQIDLILTPTVHNNILQVDKFLS